MNRKHFLASIALSVLGMAASSSTFAQERGSKDEAKALVEAAILHVKKVGIEQALKEFQADKATWTKKDLYVFAYDMEGTCRALGANEKMVGKNLLEMKDPNGKFIIKEFIAIVSSKGSGWVSYDFADPVTKKMGSKMSFVQKVPGFDGFVGVGVYL